MSKKESIVEVASKYYSIYGYDKTSLDDIAREVGVSKPAIYYHFKDKYALYEAVLCSKFNILEKEINSIDIDNPREALKSYVESFGNFLLNNPCFSAIFARELASGAKSIPKNCKSKMALILSKLSSILQEGERQNIFIKENPFMVQLMIVSTLINYQTTKNLRKEIMENLKDIKNIDAELKDIIPNLANKIIKALQC